MMSANVYEGKAKKVTTKSDREVEVFYKDDATAFNGQKHELFNGKGELNSLITEKLFHYLAKEGIPSHHLKRIDQRTLLAKRVQIIPLETVVRFKVAGSLQKRTGLSDGTTCNPPIVEFYFKNDALGDPLLNDAHIALLGLATDAELKELRDKAVHAALKLQQLFHKAQIDLVDLKFEFGRTPEGILLADEITPDTCRLRDEQTGQKLDKDVFRQGLGDLLVGYREVLRRLNQVLDN